MSGLAINSVRRVVDHPLYNTWTSMRQRCCNPKNPNYADYGGRGVTVCDRWASLAAFAEDMGSRPVGTTIDRIDVNGNYEPDNCRWSTQHEQNRNKRTSRIITIDGVSRCVADWAAALGLHRSTIPDRLERGWSERDAVMSPADALTVGRCLDRDGVRWARWARDYAGVTQQAIADAMDVSQGTVSRALLLKAPALAQHVMAVSR